MYGYIYVIQSTWLTWGNGCGHCLSTEKVNTDLKQDPTRTNGAGHTKLKYKRKVLAL